MTPLEMIKSFKYQLNLYDIKADLDSSDILYWINEAQDEYINAQFESRLTELTFQTSAKTFEALRPLLVEDKEIQCTYNSASTNAIDPYDADIAEIPQDLRFTISTRVLVIKNSPTTYVINTVDGKDKRYCPNTNDHKIVFAKISQHDDIYRLLEDPFNTTKYDRPLCEYSTSYFTIYTNNKFIADKVYLTYIKEPVEIKHDSVSPQSCELPTFAQKEIVRLAVNTFRQNINTNKNQ